jgi:hypothetical protein
MFFALQWKSVEINWSGNIRPYDNCDGNACTRLTLADGEIYGPGVGEF